MHTRVSVTIRHGYQVLLTCVTAATTKVYTSPDISAGSASVHGALFTGVGSVNRGFPLEKSYKVDTPLLATYRS